MMNFELSMFGAVCGAYWVEVSESDVTAYGMIDVDGNGIFQTHSATKLIAPRKNKKYNLFVYVCLLATVPNTLCIWKKTVKRADYCLSVIYRVNSAEGLFVRILNYFFCLYALYLLCVYHGFI